MLLRNYSLPTRMKLKKNKEYKALCFDLDGTLIGRNGRVSPRTAQLLKELCDRGVALGIATGRGRSMARYMMRDVDCPYHLMANNGAWVCTRSGECTVYPLSKSLSEVAIEKSDFLGLHPYLYIDDEKTELLLPEDTLMDYHLGSVPDSSLLAYVNEFVRPYNVLSLVWIDTPVRIRQLQKALEKVNEPYNSHIIRSFDGKSFMLEIQSPLAAKDRAMIRVFGQEGILADEIIAFGDDNNDIAMLKAAGCGVAMCNADEKVRRSADHVTRKNCYEDGVACWLEEVLKDHDGQ